MSRSHVNKAKMENDNKLMMQAADHESKQIDKITVKIAVLN